jgi:ubiquinone/menaquinone biosynthesis C-methylase UbiE
MTTRNQKAFWDKEHKQDDYCQRHCAAVHDLAVLNILDEGLRKAGVDINRISRVLEIGGGSQIISRHLLQMNDKLSIICTDISQERLNAFRQYFNDDRSNLELQGGIDAQHLPYEDNSFDLIVGDAVLHHIEIIKYALMEINRCLVPGGVAIFVREPAIGELGVQVYRALQMLNREGNHIIKNRYEYKKTLSQWQYEFVMSGFNATTITKWKKQPLLERMKIGASYFVPSYINFLLKKKNELPKEMFCFK